ncbi:MAG: phosphatase PAP2 family protein [Acidobacteriia bacterium]|nr:phosphatase PAP2 family protein [Terriglobia bacterium]
MGTLSSNFTDRLYFLFFSIASAGLLLRPGRVSCWMSWLFVNFLCLLALGLLVRTRQRSPAWEFLHDWYPLLMFIVCFEEVSHLSFLLWDAWQDHYLLRFETWLFPAPPTVWMGRLGSPLVTELMELGYFSYFLLFLIVGGLLYWRGDKRAFRQLTDATVLSYLLCYAAFVLFPTEGPAYTVAPQHNFPLPGGGPFHWAVMLIQTHAGVHGNAFPSAHVAGAVVALIFAWRHDPKLGFGLTPLVILLCLGAVYDRYHYLSDVVAGVVVGVVPATWVMATGAGPHCVDGGGNTAASR